MHSSEIICQNKFCEYEQTPANNFTERWKNQNSQDYAITTGNICQDLNRNIGMVNDPMICCSGTMSLFSTRNSLVPYQGKIFRANLCLSTNKQGQAAGRSCFWELSSVLFGFVIYFQQRLCTPLIFLGASATGTPSL